VALAPRFVEVLEARARVDQDVVVDELHVDALRHHVEAERVGLRQTLNDVRAGMIGLGELRRIGVQLAGADVASRHRSLAVIFAIIQPSCLPGYAGSASQDQPANAALEWPLPLASAVCLTS